MSEYTPTTEDWRENSKWGCYGITVDDLGEEFDRWLNSVKAEAWDEGFCSMRGENPYRTGGAQ